MMRIEFSIKRRREANPLYQKQIWRKEKEKHNESETYLGDSSVSDVVG